MKRFRVLVVNPGSTSTKVAEEEMEALRDAALRVLAGEEEVASVGG